MAAEAGAGATATTENLPVAAKTLWQTAHLNWWDFQKRRWRSMWLMKAIYERMKATETQTLDMVEAEAEKLWSQVHLETASELREHAEAEKGLFIKTCQYMSSMEGTLPDPYITAFRPLTDQLPVSSVEEVRRVIENDLGRPCDDIFSEFEAEPLASASIAQVHKARLKETGEVVAVKVQHEGVGRVFLEDVTTLDYIAKQVYTWSPDLDFRKFAEEWADSLPRELDFRQESQLQQRAHRVLSETGVRVVVPNPKTAWLSRHVLVMDYIEALPIVRLADGAFCSQHGVDKGAVMTTLLDAFGVMIFTDGFFHADPHAGNVRLIVDSCATGGATPVLFDWGLSREITNDERLGLAKLLHAVANMDTAGVWDVLNLLGIHVRKELRTDAFRRDFLERARNMMKDTLSKNQMKANVKEEMQDYRNRVHRAEDAGLKTPQASKSPIYYLEDWPHCVIFFMRMLHIVRGLCVAVDAAGLPVLQIFAKHAQEALRRSSLKQSLDSHMRVFGGRRVFESSVSEVVARIRSVSKALPRAQSGEDCLQLAQTDYEAASRNPRLQERLQQLLDNLVTSSMVVGAQVAVIESGRLTVDAAVGTLSTIDLRSVNSSTRFPLVSLTAGVATLALLRALRRRFSEVVPLRDILKLQVVEIWPEFSGGKSTSTLRDLLSYSAGLCDMFPLDFGPSVLDDVQKIVQHFEDSVITERSEARYVYLLQAFVLAKLGDCVAGNDSLLHWLDAELGDCGLDVAAPAGRGGEAAVCREMAELARVSMTEVASGRHRRRARDVAHSSSSAPGSNGSRGAEGGQQCCSLLGALLEDPTPFDPLQANAGHGGAFRGGMSLGAFFFCWRCLCVQPGKVAV
eukprot:TRINITY_DN59100_c0_g1_i3.p1 TRINITY_DN59100_c0_g1~~TRINITY_DN59100_c0_g1_i3.p1  ORF type:complete len:889 (-),score=155.10 TRINITY_DN59100_c0_g1_i3:445-3009(-)